MLPVCKAVMRGSAAAAHHHHAHVLRSRAGASPSPRSVPSAGPHVRVAIPPSAPLKRVVGFDVPPGSSDASTAALIRKFF